MIMRLSCVALLVAASLLANAQATIEDSVSRTASITTNSGAPAQIDVTKRLLRSYTNEEEERAFAKPEVFARIMGIDHTKAEAKEWLIFWLNERKSVDDVTKMLGLAGLSEKEAAQALNSAALQKYKNMYHKLITGKSLSGEAVFSRVDGIARTKTQTKDMFWKWLRDGVSVEKAAMNLGLKQGGTNPLNWRALASYQKMYSKWKANKVFAKIDGVEMTESQTSKWLLGMLAKDERAENVAKALGVWMLKQEDIPKALNWPALVKYVRMQKMYSKWKANEVFAKIDGVEMTESQTSKWLLGMLAKDERAENVAKALGVWMLKQEDIPKALNWPALVKYVGMQKMYSKWKANKVFAKIDGVEMTESQTSKWLLDMLAKDERAENVAKALGVWMLKQEDIPKALNWPALVQYVRMQKMYSKWKANKVFAKIDGVEMTESQTSKWLLGMLAKDERAENVAKALGVWMLKQEDIPKALNWPALVKYVRMQKEFNML